MAIRAPCAGRQRHPYAQRPDPFPYRASKFVRQRRKELATAMVIVVSIVSTSAVYTRQLAAERDRARSQAEKAQEIISYLIGLVEAGDPFTEPEATDVLALLDRGGVQTMRSDYDRAENLLQRALEIRRAGEADSLTVAETLSSLGVSS